MNDHYAAATMRVPYKRPLISTCLWRQIESISTFVSKTQISTTATVTCFNSQQMYSNKRTLGKL